MSEHSWQLPGGERRPEPEPASPLLWQMAARLLAHHRPRWPAPPWQAGPTCRGCGRRWPCEAHRLGQRGLLASLRRPEPPAPAGPPEPPAHRRGGTGSGG